MVRKVLVSLSALLLLGISSLTARGQDDLLAELYGEGVHLFYSGQYAEAHEIFTSAIDQGNRDPRCYYFRGMTYHYLGRPEQVDADFQAGADLETSGDIPISLIGRSLERFQGSLRIKLEKHRRKAALAIRLKEAQRKNVRYEQFKRDEKRVLRGSDSSADPSSVPANVKGDATDPFNDGAAPQPLPENNAKPAPKPAANPAAKPAPAKKVDDDPFGDSKPAAKPAAKPAPAKKATDDPFADPFAESKPAAKPAPAKKADDDDPFK